ncbi:MAG: radical SAM protein [Candidatus Saelkia tenebricola]|nr:radical SAM protein [Candidatus Saelkia tenebricola]
MNILLIRPPSLLQHLCLLPHTKPMNLAYLAAYIRKFGYNVEIIDYEIEMYNEIAFFEKLKTNSPGIVGISCTTSTIKNGAKICAVVKSFSSKIATVVGGAHANCLPQQTLHEFSDFDYLVYGEGEVTLLELCDCIQNEKKTEEIKGLVYRSEGKIIQNPLRDLIEDLDSIPFPARDLFKNRKQPGYSAKGFSNKISSAELFTSRGCPFSCAFCAVSAAFGRKARFRKTEFIEEEVKQLIEQNKVKHIVVADDTFGLDEERSLEICDIFLSHGVKSWNCETRVDKISKNLLKMMVKSGCRKVTFGIESGSQRIRDLIEKNFSFAQIEKAVYWAKEAGIEHIEGNFIIGVHPSETMEDIEMTREMIHSLPWTIISVAIIVPFPGTAIHEMMKAKDMLHEDIDWEDFEMFGRIPKWHTEHFSAKDLVILQKKMTAEFFLNPKYVFRRLISFKSCADATSWFFAGGAYLKWYFTGKT